MTYLYVLQHILAPLLLFRGRWAFLCYALVSLLLSGLIVLFSPPGIDIPAYVREAGSSGWEPLYRLFMSLGLATGLDPREVVGVFQGFVLLLASLLVFFYTRQRLLILAVILSSVAVMLAFNNALRQGAASLFLAYAVLFLIRGGYLKVIACCVLAFGFHASSAVFALLIVGVWILFECIPEFRRVANELFLLLPFLVIGTFLLPELLSVAGYSAYLDMDLSAFENRTGLLEKASLLFLIVCAGELMLRGRSISREADFLRILRATFVFVPLFFAATNGFQELGSRILFFYYFIEVMFLGALIERGYINTGVVIIVAHAFAFNVWNMIGM